MAYTEYSPRLTTRAYLERDRPTVLTAPVYYGGAIVAPTLGTVSIYDASNNAVVSAAAVTITASVATYTLAAASVTSSAYGAGWRVEWSLTMPDTYTHVYRQSASLVRVKHACPITDADLLDLHPDLASYYPSGQTSYQRQIGAVWEDCQSWLERGGRRPYLITDASALRPWVRAAALHIVCQMHAGDGDETNKWARLADMYGAAAITERDSLTLEYDETDAGRSSATERAATRPTLWLHGAGNRSNFGWGRW